MQTLVVSIGVIGLLASFVTEILQWLPSLGKNDTRKRLVALVVAIVGAIYVASTTGYLKWDSWEAFIGILIGVVGASYVTYKAIVKIIFPKS